MVQGFPKDFIWGASTAANQYEGGYDQGGKGLSVQDVFAYDPGRQRVETQTIEEDRYYPSHNASGGYDHTDEDMALLGELGVQCIEGTTPESVVAAAAECDAVLTSRLHLLILAANAGTPGFGIARGSKLANWLSNFGRSVEGSVYDCDWDLVAEHVLAAMRSRGDWDEVRRTAYERLRARLEKARGELVEMLLK